jgi:hypothetical protein
LRLALSKGPTKVGVSSPHLRAEADPMSETFVFTSFYNIERWTESKNSVIPSIMHHRQNPLESTHKIPIRDTRCPAQEVSLGLAGHEAGLLSTLP